MAVREVSDVAERLKGIRETARKTQPEFVRILDAAAESLFGPGVRRYPQSKLSRLENGLEAVTLADIAVYAAVDPKRRGKLWLAWNETVDRSMALPPRQGPSVIQEPSAEIFDQPIPRKKKPGEKRA